MDVPPEHLPNPEQVIEQKLLDCGLSLGGFTVKYEDELQGIEIVIAPSAGATSNDFACINEAAGYSIVTFENREMYSAYSDFVTELALPEMMVRLEARLKEAGLWENFPDRDDFGSLAEYAKGLEAHAGVEPVSALSVLGDAIVFDPPSSSLSYADFAERYSNFLSVVAYASTKDRVDFGFIGTERVAE